MRAEFKAGWSEVRWIGLFSLYLLPTTALAVLLAYVVDGKFSSPPSLIQVILIILACLLSLYFSIFHSKAAIRLKKKYLKQIAAVSKNTKISASKPIPKLGESLLVLFLKPAERENVVGDLEEGYIAIHSKYGGRVAAIWYYKQILSSISPLLVKLIKLTAFAGLAEMLRKLFIR
jgi:hypothetical protein